MDSRSRFKYCAPQLWLFESEGLVVYMNLFPSTQNERKKKSQYSMAKSRENFYYLD